jgi:vitamin B12 transporter
VLGAFLTAALLTGLVRPAAAGTRFPSAPAGSGPARRDATPADATPERPDTTSSRSDTVHLPGLVVTAYRMPMPREAVVSDVTVLDSATIRRSGAAQVLDLLRQVPAATVVQGGSWGSPASLFLRGGESNYVKVLVDGVPVNQAGGDFDFSTLSTTGIRRIEVVRGPTSVLYGSDAVTGVIQIFTRRGRGPPRVTADASAGTFGSLDGSVHVGGGTRAVRYGASLSRFTTDGTLPFNDGYGNTTADGSVRLRPDDRTRATVTARYEAFTAHFPTDGSGRIVDHNQYRDGRSLVLGLSAARELGDRVTAHLQIGTHEGWSGLHDAPDGPADTTGYYATSSGGRQTRRDVDLRLDLRPADRTTVSVGGTWEHEAGLDTTLSRSSFGPYRSRLDAARHDVAGYVQVVSRPASGLALTGGARLDDDATFGRFATWRAGAAYRWPTGTRLRVAAGTGFREPTFLENFGGGGIRGNPDLAPERSRSWEVGASQLLAGGRVDLHATWFDQHFRDIVQFTFSTPAPDAPNYFNVPSALSRGLETGFELRPLQELTVRGSYTYLDTRTLDAGFDSGPDATFVRGRPLLRRPSHSGSLSATWSPEGRGSVTVGVTSAGPRWDRDFSVVPAVRVELPGYARTDLSGSWTLIEAGAGRPGLRATLRVENLFDRRYLEAVGFPARGRTLFLGARASMDF